MPNITTNSTIIGQTGVTTPTGTDGQFYVVDEQFNIDGATVTHDHSAALMLKKQFRLKNGAGVIIGKDERGTKVFLNFSSAVTADAWVSSATFYVEDDSECFLDIRSSVVELIKTGTVNDVINGNKNNLRVVFEHVEMAFSNPTGVPFLGREGIYYHCLFVGNLGPNYTLGSTDFSQVSGLSIPFLSDPLNTELTTLQNFRHVKAESGENSVFVRIVLKLCQDDFYYSGTGAGPAGEKPGSRMMTIVDSSWRPEKSYVDKGGAIRGVRTVTASLTRSDTGAGIEDAELCVEHGGVLLQRTVTRNSVVEAVPNPDATGGTELAIVGRATQDQLDNKSTTNWFNEARPGDFIELSGWTNATNNRVVKVTGKKHRTGDFYADNNALRVQETGDLVAEGQRSITFKWRNSRTDSNGNAPPQWVEVIYARAAASQGDGTVENAPTVQSVATAGLNGSFSRSAFRLHLNAPYPYETVTKDVTFSPAGDPYIWFAVTQVHPHLTLTSKADVEAISIITTLNELYDKVFLEFKNVTKDGVALPDASLITRNGKSLTIADGWQLQGTTDASAPAIAFNGTAKTITARTPTGGVAATTSITTIVSNREVTITRAANVVVSDPTGNAAVLLKDLIPGATVKYQLNGSTTWTTITFTGSSYLLRYVVATSGSILIHQEEPNGTIIQRVYDQTKTGTDNSQSLAYGSIASIDEGTLDTKLEGVENQLAEVSTRAQTTQTTLTSLLVTAQDGGGQAFSSEALENAPSTGTGGGSGLTTAQSQTLTDLGTLLTAAADNTGSAFTAEAFENLPATNVDPEAITAAVQAGSSFISSE